MSTPLNKLITSEEDRANKSAQRRVLWIVVKFFVVVIVGTALCNLFLTLLAQ